LFWNIPLLAFAAFNLLVLYGTENKDKKIQGSGKNYLRLFNNEMDDYKNMIPLKNIK
jgi:hypothetical protein